ncbi:fimbria/pilus outer membrane usher protein [Burkholderia seminalis]|uniref:fimbria/pilus outer membrane usher protein n=1 Tax=Burkholderia seminalis TaxID=488731 RepID=UPI0022352C73|nr:fimbria/pilus outer membrane usher protein [Burkholderia seminalis]MDN7586827.1 fimbria/pilus outer membrane usher protein [Burkholderia seminalis]
MKRSTPRHRLASCSSSQPPRVVLRPHVLAWSAAWALGLIPAPSLAEPEAVAAAGAYVEFNTAFLGPTTTSKMDISRYERGNPVLPGTYSVDLFVNEEFIARPAIVFRTVAGKDAAQPCFTYDMLLQMGINLNKLDQHPVGPQSTCISLQDIEPDASARMDVNALRLDVSIPQATMVRRARGYVDPQLWDQGQSALLLGYNFNVYSVNQRYAGGSTSGGQAIGPDGAPVSVQNGTYFRLGSDGTYVPSNNGGFMLSPDGRYVPVRPGSFTAARSGGGYDNVNAYLGLNMGLNAGGWRLRSQGNLVWDQQSGRALWTNIGSTASHDVTALKAQATLGQSATQGIIFDSTPFRGATLYSDDRMLPDSMQGFAPVVRGVANTRARVELRQNGMLIYETTVAPGPFVIDDLYSTSYGGDITVTVFEANGNTHSFVVPFSAVPMLLRPGVGRWAVTAGQVYYPSLNQSTMSFFEGTYQRGINNWLTLYGGLQVANGSQYTNMLLGAAVNTPMGAFATDLSRSSTRLGQTHLSGDSVRVSYSKTIPTSQTTFMLATYRYSDGGYQSLSDATLTKGQLAAAQGAGYSFDPSSLYLGRNKLRLQVTLSQSLGDRYGSVYFNGLRNTYWGQSNSSATYQFGYSNSWRGMTIGITAGRTYAYSGAAGGGRFDNQIGINLSVPLGRTAQQAPTLTLMAQHDDNSGNTSGAAISGTFGEFNQYNYNAAVNYQDRSGDATTVSGGLGWAAPYGHLNGSYSVSDHYRQGALGASGGVVVHGGGVTLAPQMDLNSPVAIIHAPDAQGARVTSGGQTKIDGRGYAIAAGLTPYRMNDVILDPSGTSVDVELQTTRLQTAPRAGAVVPMTFQTSKGRALLIRSQRANGESIPLGSDVSDAQGNLVGMVGQGGQIFVRTALSQGDLQVQWGADPSQQCRIEYSVPDRTVGDSLQALTAITAICQ